MPISLDLRSVLLMAGICTGAVPPAGAPTLDINFVAGSAQVQERAPYCQEPV